MITCCPLSDGYEYAFETDYAQAWGWFIDGVGAAAATPGRAGVAWNTSHPSRATRSSCPTPAPALAACLQIELPNVGVTMDIGHALAGEGTRQAAALLAQAGKLFLVHVNDNYRNWDWDMIPGSVNPGTWSS